MKTEWTWNEFCELYYDTAKKSAEIYLQKQVRKLKGVDRRVDLDYVRDSAALTAMEKAYAHFDASRGAKITTFLSTLVHNEIVDQLEKESKAAAVQQDIDDVKTAVKALKALARRQRDSFLNEQAAAEIFGGASANEIDYREWRESVYEIALQQLLADESIHERTKQVFVRLAIDGEKPEAVAESLGIPYNTVIRIRKRAIARLRSYVEAMKKA